MDWIQLTLNTSKDQVDLISEVLTGLGSISIAFEDTNDDEIFELKTGNMSLWENVTITALFTIVVNQDAIKRTLNKMGHINEVDFSLLKDRVWEDECKKDFHAMQFGNRLWILPSWESNNQLPSNAAIVKMDPGLAFGTGTHQTTNLCLQYLDKNPPINQNIIDYGCGTGILAIAAVKLGAIQGCCVDNDPQALIAARHNINNNQLTRQIIAIHTDNESQLAKTDLLIANILAKPLVDLCTHFSKLIKSGGKIVLSGILSEQLPMILDVYSKFFTKLVVVEKDNWCLVSGESP